ncbi:hypothetical protein L218DRAFT_1082305 [Marasmius fiardii PR-910]|nr:hypothetical protein L218DRAFT_1082305 [Marasmius fiardii PR-910]
MIIPTAAYYIRTAQGNLVGRAANEDRSMRPKPIVMHPKGAALKDAGVWNVREKWEGSNAFVMCNKDMMSYTCHIGEDVFAIMDNHGPPPEFWMILEQPQHGPDMYIITSNNRQVAWVAPDRDPLNAYDVEPILVEPVNLSPGSTPEFPPEALFKITPVGSN